MASAGTVTVDFVAEVARFNAEMKKVQGQLKAVADDSKRSKDQFDRFVGTLKGLAIGTALVAGFRAVIKATAESEAAIAKFNQQLRNSGQFSVAASQDYQDFAQQIQRTSTITDEAALGVTSLLLSFKGLSGTTVKGATQAVVDMSAALGVDLESAAKSVGKALQDPVGSLGALSKAGVAFSDDQKRVIKALVESGNTAKAQSIILGEIESRFKGAGEAARNNFAGALTALKISAGDLLEVKGGLPGVTTELNNLAGILQDPDVRAGADALFSGIATGLGTIVGLLAHTGTFFKDLGEAAAHYFHGADTQLGQLEDQLADVDKRLAASRSLGESITPVGLIDRLFGTNEARNSELEAMRQQILGQIKTLKAELAAVAPAPTARATAGLLPVLDEVVISGTRIDPKKALARQEEVKRGLEDLLGFMDSEQQRVLAVQAEVAASITDLHWQTVDSNIAAIEAGTEASSAAMSKRLADARAFTDAEIQLREQGLNFMLGLLNNNSKNVQAIQAAAFLWNKRAAISEALVDAKVAIGKALRSYPVPWNYAAAASVAAVTAANIASMSGIQFGSTSSSSSTSSGSSITGGSAQSDISSSSTTAAEQAGASSQSVTQVIFNGDIAGEESARWMIEKLKEAINDRDVVIISDNSRQAQQLK